MDADPQSKPARRGNVRAAGGPVVVPGKVVLSICAGCLALALYHRPLNTGGNGEKPQAGDSSKADKDMEEVTVTQTDVTTAKADVDPEVQKNRSALADRLQLVQKTRATGDVWGACALLPNAPSEDPSEPMELRLAAEDLLADLKLETNRPGEALDALLRMWRLVSPSQDSKLAKKMMRASAFAGRTPETLPLQLEWMGKSPLGQASWQSLTEMAQAYRAKHKLTGSLTPELLIAAGLTAQALDWNNKPQEAFHWHRIAALFGNRASLKRTLALSESLEHRSEEMALLHELVPVADNPALTLLYGRLCGQCGEFATATKVYDQWITNHPQDSLALQEAANLADDTGETDKACQLWRRALNISPKDALVQRHCAESFIAVGHGPEALEIFNQIPVENFDALLLEDYALLAETVGDPTSRLRALRLRLERVPNAQPVDFVEAAASAVAGGQRSDQIQLLTSGVNAWPRNLELVRALGEALLDDERLPQTVNLLEQDWLKNDAEAMSLYLEAACLSEQFDRIAAFLGNEPEKLHPFPAHTRLHLAVYHRAKGRQAQSDALVASVPEEPRTLQLLAEARYLMRDMPDAERLMRRCVTTFASERSDAWTLMGDILDAEGRDAEADEAFDMALTLVRRRLAQTDTNPENALAHTHRFRE